jgi:hypothetical protein
VVDVATTIKLPLVGKKFREWLTMNLENGFSVKDGLVSVVASTRFERV